jgi:hypothetical protein
MRSLKRSKSPRTVPNAMARPARNSLPSGERPRRILGWMTGFWGDLIMHVCDISRFSGAIILRAARDTRVWARRSLRERALLALAAFAGTLSATCLYRGFTRDGAVLGLASGILSLVALAITQFVLSLGRAPVNVREANTYHPGKPVRLLIQLNPGTRRLDQLQHDALHVAKKLEEYRVYRKILGCGALNDQHADRALADFIREIESFGARAHTLGSEVVSRRSRKEARALYNNIRSPTHATDLDALLGMILAFARPRRLGWLASRRQAAQ